jgi:hypothetical protein
MVYLDSAYYGDEKSSRNVTKSLIDRIKNNTLDGVANESLYPAVETTDEVKLTAEDEKNITSDALKKCNAADQKCLEAEKQRLRQERFKEKEREAIDSTPAIKGYRLTMNVINDDGTRKTIVVPSGQKFNVQNMRPREEPSISLEDIKTIAWSVIGIGVTVLIYALFILIPFKILKDDGNMPFAWGTTGANIITPPLGASVAAGKYFWQGWTSDKNTPKQ